MGSRRRSGLSPYQRLATRAVFAVSLLFFLVLGIVIVGDFTAQWWVLLIPVALLVGPVLAARREARGERNGPQDGMPWS